MLTGTSREPWTPRVSRQAARAEAADGIKGSNFSSFRLNYSDGSHGESP
jgi:hypothetical protein